MRHTGSMSCPGRCGALCGYSSNGCGRPNHQGAQPNHHHHHSHFDRWGVEDSYIISRALCGSGWGVPGGSSGKLGAMQHYHRWTPFLFLRDLDPLDQGDGRDLCSGQRPNGKREGARIWSNWNSFLSRHFRPGKSHEIRRVELLV